MKRRPGRPPLFENPVVVNLSLPSKLYDEYATRALREDVSVPEIIRRELARRELASVSEPDGQAESTEGNRAWRALASRR